MPRKGHSEEQIIAALQQSEGGERTELLHERNRMHLRDCSQ